MKKDDIRTLIVIISICLVCYLIFSLLNTKSNTEKLEPVKEYNVFFNNNNYINDYLNYMSKNEEEKLNSILDKEYVTNNNTNKSNFLENSIIYENNSSISTMTMKQVKVKGNYIYVIEGKIIQNIMDGTKVINDNFIIALLVDYDNFTFSIYPIKKEKDINKIKKINIEPNEYNNVQKSNLITKEQICSLYLSNYVNMLFTDFDKSYSILNSNMIKKYPTKEKYKKYIDKNINKLTTSADKCNVEKSGNNRIYTVIDINGNIYRFTELSVMNYLVDQNLEKE